MSSNQTPNLSPPFFNGENYQVWAVKMKTHLKGLGLWTWVESEREIQPLTDNPTLNQIKLHENESSKGPRALSIIHTAMSESIFTRIMTCETGKEAWDKLKELYEGNARIKRMQVLNLKRDFETLAMKEKDTIQDYYDNLMGVINKMRLMEEDVPDSKIVEKLFVSLPERFESKLSSLEDSKDISELSLSELINSLQAQEQRRAMRNKETENAVEGAFLAKTQKQKIKFTQCGHCKKNGHEEKDCWNKERPKCFKCKRFGHVQKYCRVKTEESVNKTQVFDEELF
ncbi:uncharacterized protein LOC141714052 [Apium graveolens]|uniref:uncharacterized protein LOC141714052 n=1 Tax=Apium graveolens TaxID=4045 RepID=UPI003D7BE500